ncbi:uricase-2 [Pyrus ussuriensis x Pyrus communis]|uniref:factor independent urate hydroxylase n=1 Tax=Pyrus ussuriensis x Pyrus communis TaxID=2448454 RepID=A0A5N5EVE2_9ROSA|nr:uricase-2 [Pyrus ussuriensis x Pyrus communis]
MANRIEGFNFEQRHGKQRVRVARVWRNIDGRQTIVEWNVGISLLSDCVSAYTRDDNSDIVATDTMKNTVYVKAKECKEELSVEEFAVRLAKHFTSLYQQVTTAIVRIVEKPWERAYVDGQPHEHGFKLGSEKHTTEVILKKSGALRVTSGIEGLSLLKTTKSGFEGFIRDKYTALPDTRERILATEITASWKYQYESIFSIPQKTLYFTERYLSVKKALADTFYGPPKEGVYSPSVQSTLYHMAKTVLNGFPDIEAVQLKMPNIHFLPVNLSNKDNTIVKVRLFSHIPCFPAKQLSTAARIFPSWCLQPSPFIACLNYSMLMVSALSSSSVTLIWKLLFLLQVQFTHENFFLLVCCLQFEDDVYLPTDEPHGSIEATLSRFWSKT